MRSRRKPVVKIVARRKCPRKHFRSEMNILYVISHHRNILETFKVFYCDSYIYGIMELFERGDVTNYLAPNGPLNSALAKTLFGQLSAVGHMHLKEITQRDLKCDHILLCGEGQIKVADFGLAIMCAHSKDGQPIQCESYPCTPPYATPEVLKHVPYNPKIADVCSMGCFLLCLLTGRFPFPLHRKEIMLLQHAELLYPEDIILDVEVKHLIRHMLETDVNSHPP